MSRFDPSAYKAVLAVKGAYRFDAGTFLMRMFQYTTTIGTITMLTLAGASALEATTVSSVLAASTFLVAPRVSRRIDERGQSAVVPAATAIGLAGIALMVCTVQFGLPFWLNYIGAFFGSFLPNAAAIARARWAYLIQTRCLGKDTPPLKSAYAFEGILEDIAFMVGPAASIAVAAATVPVGGMLGGALMYLIGAAILMTAKSTEPDPVYLAQRAAAQRAAAGEDGESGASVVDAPIEKRRNRSVFRTCAVVRVLFFTMTLMGCMYGAFDTAAVNYAESIDWPVLASAVFAIESFFSLLMSTLFGMVRLSIPLHRQFTLFAVAFGAFYALVFLIGSPVSFVVIPTIAGLSYAPLLITANVVCECAVPEANLTEAMSWMNSGMSVGMVIGPVASGAVIDAVAPLAGFDVSAGFAMVLAVVSVATLRIVRKSLQR